MYKKYIKFIFDYLFSFLIIIIFLPFFIFIFFFMLFLNGRPVFFIQRRIGFKNKFFNIYKFRTLELNTKDIPTNQIIEYNYIKCGNFLRRTNLDEIPQIVNVIKGEMSLVGPRPALFNQSFLIKLRTKKNIHKLKPGITGYAQINGKRKMSDKDKLEFDLYYLNNLSFFLDFKILLSTIKFFFIRAPKH